MDRLCHQWVIEKETDSYKSWRCATCARVTTYHRGVMTDDREFEQAHPTFKDDLDTCDIKKRIAHLRSELERLEKRVSK